MRNKMINLILAVLLAGWLSSSCNTDYYPKPRGYFRIDLPEHLYQAFDTTFPYKFEYPVYSSISADPMTRGNQYFINLDFEQFQAKVHLSYKSIDNNLNEYLEDTRTLAMKHMPKASAIKTETFLNEKNKVFGLTYSIDGVEAASPYQFYLTDSTNHFVRGALYFNVVPNNDSLSPVIEFLKDDIRHMIETFEWSGR